MSGPPESITLVLAVFAGLLSFASPCVLPLVPAYVGYLSGVTLGEKRGRSSTMAHAVAFVTGFTLMFMIFGFVLAAIGIAIFNVLPLGQKVGGVVLVALGLYQLGLLRLRFLNAERRLSLPDGRRWGLVGSALAGVTFSLGWVPCASIVLSGVVYLASTSQTAARGALLLTLYALAQGVPFLLLAFVMNEASGLRRRIRVSGRAVSTVSGLFVVMMGVAVFNNWLLELGYLAIRKFNYYGPTL